MGHKENRYRLKKHKATAPELANDPSLRWCPYRYAETVYSDTHGAELRFLRYEGVGRVVLATLNGIAPLPGTVDALTVRRLTAQPQKI